MEFLGFIVVLVGAATLTIGFMRAVAWMEGLR